MGARTAIYCWAFAKANEGTFLLRIEDTDQKRSSKQATTGFFEDLKWLNILWDEGPVFEQAGGGDEGPYNQSLRLGNLQRAITKNYLMQAWHITRLKLLKNLV